MILSLVLYLGATCAVSAKLLRSGTYDQLRATRHCKSLHKELSIDNAIKKADPQRLWLWWTDYWEPTWSCPLEERIMFIGEPRTKTSGDGGKWVCDVPHIPKGPDKCLVYSFGSHGDYSFELGVSEEMDCEIHTFDPFTLGTKPANANIHTHSWGLSLQAHETSELPWWNNEVKIMKSLSGIKSELGHKGRDIDVLKIDIDGVEFGIFDSDAFWIDLRRSGVVFKQLLIEIHFEGISTDRFTPDFLTASGTKKVLNTGEAIDRMLRVITANGYVMFHKEVNLAANDACEYSFVKLDIDC